MLGEGEWRFYEGQTIQISSYIWQIQNIYYYRIIINSYMEDNFICPLCLQLAKNAVQSSCCTKIYCEKCIDDIFKKFGHCPCCRSPKISWHPSKIARKVISEIKVPCEYCQAKVESGAMESHKSKCPKMPLACRLCKQVLLQQLIPKHTATFHQKQAKDYLIAYALGIKGASESKINTPQPIDKAAAYFKITKNKEGRKAALGDVAKYYCGGPLQGKCSCCNGECGPDNGQNCDGCMLLDINRWNIGKGYLINTAGYICQAIPGNLGLKICCFRVLGIKKSLSLFSSAQQIQCKYGTPCQSCTQMEYSIKIGRYKGLY